MSDSTYFAPGEYIEYDMYEDYSSRLGISVDDLEDLINGVLPIDYDLAKRIEKVTGVSAETWLNLQKRYDKRKEA